ncbi:MAG: hypothetical protein GTO18_10175 [Anaerolineales bacterium]|nr:hypothetical protein [Anaerolineales bacterium]
MDAMEGVVLNNGRVQSWRDQSGNGLNATQDDLARQPKYQEREDGQYVIHFDGIDDFLSFSPLEVNGLSRITLVLVSANWKYTENVKWGDEGGSHGTVNAALHFEEVGEPDVWGCVYLNPFQHRVTMRFGTGQEGNINTWSRPQSVGESMTITVAMKCSTEEFLYVDGELVGRYFEKKNQNISYRRRRLVGTWEG